MGEAATKPRRILQRGESAPWFRAPAIGGLPNYAFDTVAGRHVLLLLFGSAAAPEAAQALALIRRHRHLFDDADAAFFGLTRDLADAEQGRAVPEMPGIRFFLDLDRRIADSFGTSQAWVLLDPRLRVLATFPIEAGEQAIAELESELRHRPDNQWAPVLEVPNVLPRELCERLIQGYEADGGEPSGFMREADGKTVLVVDPQHKQRKDWLIDDDSLRQEIVGHIQRTLTVPVQRAFQFRATRIERYIVACYEPGAGHFRPHRDNTTRGTAHRRFAVTINLNADGYEGGDLRFPEFGQRTYRAPTGGAVVFSCSLLHEATPVTRGRRFAFLPFLYDEEAAKLREANNAFLGEGVAEYKRG